MRDAHFLDLDIGLPVQELKAPIRKVLAGAKEAQVVTVPARNRRGHGFQCRVTCMPLGPIDGIVRGAILVIEDDAARQLENTESV